MTTISAFPSAVVAPLGEEPEQFGYWCPWCETSHAHGLAGMMATEAIGRTESRVAHCDPHRSPIPGRGVELTIDRIVRTWEHLDPPGPFLAVSGDPDRSRVLLCDVLAHGRLGLALLRLVFGKNRPARGFDGRLVGGWVQVWGGGSSWFVQNQDRDTLAEGRGLGSLLARLFGVPIGVVAIRVLDAALALDLPADWKLHLAEMITRAAARNPIAPAAEEVPT